VSYGVEADVFHPVRAKQGMVASVDETATRVGVDILKQGATPWMPPWRLAMRWP
jgi:gamma-glutamyltranspeptidase/glutathione hydrolase